jgi:diguanylate cyclase (GGDEF)-like protein
LSRRSAIDLAERIARLPRSLHGPLDRAEAVAGLIGEAHDSLDPVRIAGRLVARVAEWVPMTAWAVFAGEWSNGPRLLASRGLLPELAPVAKALATRTLQNERRLLTSHLSREIKDAPDVAAIALPLDGHQGPAAVAVGLDDRAAAHALRLPPQARALLDRGLAVFATALDAALRLERAEALSVTDDLTQLYNARFLSQVLRRESKRAKRTGRQLSVLFIDFDGFKDVNDTWGHLSGSRALWEAAQVFRRTARESDVVARFGGDEFAVVLPDTPAAGARSLARRIRDRVAAFEFLQSEGLRVRLTVSIGIATYPGAADTADGLLAAADQAMYWIKERGKNGIRVAPAVRAARAARSKRR